MHLVNSHYYRTAYKNLINHRFIHIPLVQVSLTERRNLIIRLLTDVETSFRKWLKFSIKIVKICIVCKDIHYDNWLDESIFTSHVRVRERSWFKKGAIFSFMAKHWWSCCLFSSSLRWTSSLDTWGSFRTSALLRSFVHTNPRGNHLLIIGRSANCTLYPPNPPLERY